MAGLIGNLVVALFGMSGTAFVVLIGIMVFAFFVKLIKGR